MPNSKLRNPKYRRELVKYEIEKAIEKVNNQEVIITEEIAKARKDFDYFCWFLTRHLPSDMNLKGADHHREWDKFLITGKDSKYLSGIAGANTAILASRGSAKSTRIGLFIAWAIGVHALEKKALQILYVSASLSIAQAKSATIKNILLSEEYQKVFPCIAKGARWSDTYWGIDRAKAGIESTGQEEFTLIAAGVTGSIVSKRSSLVLFDDIIKSSDDIANIAIREKIQRNIHTVIKPTLLDGGRMIAIGTRFRPDDVFCTDFIEEKGWQVIEQSALIDDGKGGLKSYWEKMWSTEYLKKLQKEDPYGFSFQYQNKVLRVEGMSIDPRWIRYKDMSLDMEFDQFAIGIDLAVSEKEKACYTVMTLIGKKGEYFYIIDGRRGKWISNLEKCQIILELYEEWDNGLTPWRIFIEDVAYQASLVSDFTQYIYNEKKLHSIQVHGTKLKGDKLSHLLSMTGVFHNGLVYFNKYIDWSSWVSELTEFGSTPHNDCVDSMAIAMKGLGVRPALQSAMDVFHSQE